MNNSIDIEYMIVDDSNKGLGTHYKYSASSIESMIRSSTKLVSKMKTLVAREKERGEVPYMDKREWLFYSAVRNEDLLRGAHVLVVGSSEPYLEAFLLALDVGLRITVLEYNRLTYNHSAIRTVSHEQFDAFYAEVAAGFGTDGADEPFPLRFDAVFSVSSFDHDGLGRYNDPMSSDADIRSMRRLYAQLLPSPGPCESAGGCVARPPQHVFLTLPVGLDRIVFNMLRRYGRVRLPHMLNGFQERAQLVTTMTTEQCGLMQAETVVEVAVGEVVAGVNCSAVETVTQPPEEVLLVHGLRKRSGGPDVGFSYVLRRLDASPCAGVAAVRYGVSTTEDVDGATQSEPNESNNPHAFTRTAISRRVVYSQRVGWTDSSLDYDGSSRKSVEPVILLRKEHEQICCSGADKREYVCSLDEFVSLLA
jgi:hypothetical protein